MHASVDSQNIAAIWSSLSPVGVHPANDRLNDLR
jgi:hypothetical protein